MMLLLMTMMMFLGRSKRTRISRRCTDSCVGGGVQQVVYVVGQRFGG
jgi:hypothetical protein